MCKALVPTFNVKDIVRGRSSYFFSLLIKTAEASLIELHEKVNKNETVCHY